MQSKLRATVAAVVAAITLVFLVVHTASSPTNAQGTNTAPAFLQVGSCYDFVLPVPSAPYKLLEVLEGGWILVEIDAGPSSAARSRLWINMASVIGVRSIKCSS